MGICASGSQLDRLATGVGWLEGVEQLGNSWPQGPREQSQRSGEAEPAFGGEALARRNRRPWSMYPAGNRPRKLVPEISRISNGLFFIIIHYTHINVLISG